MKEARTKIHCTVGPASADAETLTRMIAAGADVFRVNGAHAGEGEITAWVERVREAARLAGRYAGVLVDLPGTKFRIGDLADDEPVSLEPSDEIVFDADEKPGDRSRVPLRSMPYFTDVRKGAVVVLGDGSERLEVLKSDERSLTLRAFGAMEIRRGMGVHFPGMALPTAVPTRRDRALLEVAVAAGADMISQSFVRSADDVARVRELLQESGARHTLLIAKVERLDAVHAIDAIMARADGVLLGRGDLGIDAGVEQVPSLQRRVLEAGRRAGRPVVIATEMLDSMIREVRPTRAEASDVAGAVFDGADGVMLSGETAIGAHPVLVVETMTEILKAAEADPSAPYAGSLAQGAPRSKPGRPDQHVVHAAVSLAEETGANAIVVFTRQGSSAFRLSKERPTAPIHAFAANDEACRRLTLAWGVRPQKLPAARATDEVLAFVRDHVYGPGGLGPGDRAVLVMGSAKDPAGATTLIKLYTA